MKIKNYDGNLYLKGNLKEILHTDTLNAYYCSSSVILFPEDVSKDQAIESLKTLKVILEDYRKKEDGTD